MDVKIALAGNPNSGKTTMFNNLTGNSQYVGNWPGVTVEKKEGRLKKHKNVVIQDLPGIYSLSPYTMEEKIAKDYLLNETPEAILNIVDGTNLERNLYLTLQLLELSIPMVVAVNMMDVVNKSGDVINLKKLSELLGCKVIETSGLKGTGSLEAAELAVLVAGKTKGPMQVSESLHEEEGDALVEKRYEKVNLIISQCLIRNNSEGLSVSDKIDKLVTNRVLALPIFAFVMFMVYFISITTIGAVATDWANDTLFGTWILPSLGGVMEAAEVAPWLSGLIVDGILGGVGAVLGFLPQMLILFLILSILEDCGYMARVAFIMDRIFCKMGLSGKSFIPMLIGSGCSVPGIMASRTIERESDRRLTIITTPFIPCGAKMPIVALIAGALFGGAWWVAPTAYFIGVAAVIVSGLILKRMKAFAGDVTPFIMELPPYHMPTVRGTLRTSWERGLSFIKKAGTIILLSSIVLWFLQAFGYTNGVFHMVEDNNTSLLAAVGIMVAPIFAPLGFGTWQATVGTVTGLIAKENVVGTLGVLYGFGEVGESGTEYWVMFANDFTALSAFSFLIFNLLCAPCFAAIGAIKREMNSTKWTLFAVGYLSGFAYVVSFLVYQIGMIVMYGFEGLNFATLIVALILSILVIAVILKMRNDKKNGIGGCGGGCGGCANSEACSAGKI